MLIPLAAPEKGVFRDRSTYNGDPLRVPFFFL